MRPPHDPNEVPSVEGEHAQLWLRQRRLQVQSKPETSDDTICACANANETHTTRQPRAIDSVEILAGRREVQIVHAGDTYRLLVTRNNKLILQK